MNRIEKLLDGLCPNGVNFVKISDVAEVGTGSTNGNQATDGGEFPLYVRSKEIKFIDFYEFDEEAIVIPGEGGVGEIFHYVKGKYSLHQRAYRIHFVDRKVDTKFAYYYFTSKFREFIVQKAVSATVDSIRKPMIEEFPIPLPPLPIQNEIVKILNKFNQLVAELEKERIERNKQFVHYRENACQQDSKSHRKFHMKPLGEVASLVRGRRFVKDDILEFGVPAIHYGELYTKFRTTTTHSFSFLDQDLAKKLRKAKSGDVVMVAAGETIEDIGKSVAWLGTEDVVIHDACIGVSSKILNPIFLAFYFDTFAFRSQLREHITSSKISAISPERLSKVLVPIPDLKSQNEIANQFLKFDSLLSDLEFGIPAEIQARRKQYEYYREKLLTFKELKSA